MHDAIIIGAGPVGLALAASLESRGCSVALVERQEPDRLARPAFDGREIALTRTSRAILTELGAWERLPPDEIFPLRAARVLNGHGRRAMTLSPADGRGSLGDLVPNFRIRAALFDVVRDRPGIALSAGAEVRAARDEGRDGVVVDLASGRSMRARALIAADSRLSMLRGLFGIGAEICHLSKTMLVFRVLHERPHDRIATEWFAHGLTIATLPLGPGQSSIVLTVAPAEAARLMRIDDAGLSAYVGRHLAGRLGTVRIASSRHAYPLVVTCADRFATGRVALAGDAAIGMHPVTAHGFNFGLMGQRRIADALSRALHDGTDVARALGRYAIGHRRETRPLYLATNAITRLFTRESPAGHMLRQAVISAGTRLAPVRSGLVDLLG
jgi:ubiquinone biosynthesis UbiH/UbiF/VisC/COQ6 family hydroxylase